MTSHQRKQDESRHSECLKEKALPATRVTPLWEGRPEERLPALYTTASVYGDKVEATDKQMC